MNKRRKLCNVTLFCIYVVDCTVPNTYFIFLKEMGCCLVSGRDFTTALQQYSPMRVECQNIDVKDCTSLYMYNNYFE